MGTWVEMTGRGIAGNAERRHAAYCGMPSAMSPGDELRFHAWEGLVG